MLYTTPVIHETTSTSLASDPRLQGVFKSFTPPVVIFPVSHAVGLSVIRTLEDFQIPILAVDFKPQAAGLFSNRVTSLLMPDLYKDEETFMQGIRKIGACFKAKPVLFCVDDEDLFLTLKHRETFAEYYHLPLSDWDIVSDIVNKGSFYKKLAANGFPVPVTVHAENVDDLNRQKDAIPFPCIIKPCYSTAFRQLFGVKAKRFDDHASLIDYARKLDEAGLEYIVQEFIDGGAERLVTYAAYSRDGGEVVASFTGRKVHQFPADFGTCRLGECINHPELEKLGRRLLQILGYRGISLTEFKMDDKGTLKAIELNPRPGDWPERLAQISGSNLVFAAYRDTLGLPVEPTIATGYGRKWVNMLEDLYYCVRGYKLLGFPYAHRGLLGWLRDLKGLKTCAFFSWTDPVPGLVRARGMIKDFLKRERQLRK